MGEDAAVVDERMGGDAGEWKAGMEWGDGPVGENAEESNCP
jgi:hypothetical protein